MSIRGLGVRVPGPGRRHRAGVLAGLLQRGNAGSNTSADRVTALDMALADNALLSACAEDQVWLGWLAIAAATASS
jgi:hypothetical protein